MSCTLGFDVYGTLVDPFGMEGRLKALFGGHGSAMCGLWRQKQLEYSFRRGLMRCYEDFDVCTHQALQFTLRTFKVELSSSEQRQLLADYLSLPAFPDVLPALKSLQESGCLLLAFSNGVETSLRALLHTAGVLPYLAGIVSVDDVKTFKPSPDVYAYFVSKGDRDLGDTWLISSNSFDVIGAKSAKLKAAWIRRNPDAVLDPWAFEPDIVISSLAELAGALKSYNSHGRRID